jgi:hypothetical protein
MSATHTARAAAVGSFLLLAACTTPPAVLPGFQDTPSTINFSVTDVRPEIDKTHEILSLLVTSCQYGIYRLADERSNPSRMVLLRHDLETGLGSRLHDVTLVVSEYRMYINRRAPLRDTVNGAFHGGAAVIVAPLVAAGEGCTKEETGDAWFDASDTDAAAAIIIEIQAQMGAKKYAVRSVSGLVAPEQASDSQQIFGALRKADAALAEQLGKDLPAQ